MRIRLIREDLACANTPHRSAREADLRRCKVPGLTPPMASREHKEREVRRRDWALMDVPRSDLDNTSVSIHSSGFACAN